jgi:hypothetical protein
MMSGAGVPTGTLVALGLASRVWVMLGPVDVLTNGIMVALGTVVDGRLWIDALAVCGAGSVAAAPQAEAAQAMSRRIITLI